jgi:hypothetical protein
VIEAGIVTSIPPEIIIDTEERTHMTARIVLIVSVAAEITRNTNDVRGHQALCQIEARKLGKDLLLPQIENKREIGLIPESSDVMIVRDPPRKLRIQQYKTKKKLKKSQLSQSRIKDQRISSKAL